MTGMPDPRRHAPAALRNRDPIAAVLSRFLPSDGLALEIASGSGEHATYFAAAFPGLIWQPSDPAPPAIASIEAYRRESGLTNLRSPIMLDVCASDWPIDAADAMLCINMIHIAPWRASEALMQGASRLLPPGGVLYLYGPYKENGVHTAESNLRFDEDLRARDPDWGVRDLGDILALAERGGLVHRETVIMPANNRSVIFEKRASTIG